MQVDWRGLLSSLRIEWADRGANTTAGNVNIKCPWCRDDPSHHLAIAEAREAYYCWRDPNRHSGRSFVGLLMKLGQTRYEAMRLLKQYQSARPTPVITKAARKPLKLDHAWDRFAAAQGSEEHLAYLTRRGFWYPKSVCELFDLRYAPQGAWAQRLLIPLHMMGEVVSWTGRDIRPNPHLRYRMQELEGYEPFYSPDLKKPKRETMIVVEGPMDALPIAYACRHLPIIVVALCGKALGSGKLLQLRNASLGCDSCLVAMDANVSTSTCYTVIRELAGAIKCKYIGRAKLPVGVDDPGELQSEGIIPWVQQHLSQLSRHGVAAKEYN